MTKGLDLTRVSSKGQIVVPLHIREKLEVAEGDTFAIYEHKGLLVLKKLTHPLGKEDVQARQLAVLVLDVILQPPSLA